MAWRLRANVQHIYKLIFTWNLRMGDRGWNFPWLDPRWRSLVISRILWKRFTQISEWKTHGCTTSVVQRSVSICTSISIRSCRDRLQRFTGLPLWDTMVVTWFRYPVKLVRRWEFMLRNCWTSMELTTWFQSISRMTLPVSTWIEKWSLKKSTVWTTSSSVLRRSFDSREASMTEQSVRS